MEINCSSCKYYQAYYHQGKNWTYYRAGYGQCWFGIINGNWRVPRDKKDSTSACDGYVAAETDNRKKLSFQVASEDEKIQGVCTFFFDNTELNVKG